MKPQYALGSSGLKMLMSSNCYMIRKWFAQDTCLIVENTSSKIICRCGDPIEKEWYIALRTVHMCRSQRMRWLGSVTTSWRQRTRKNTESYWNMIRHSMCPWCMMSFPADEFLLQSLLEVIIPLSMFRLLAVRAGLHYGGEVHRSWKKRRFSIVIGRKCNSWPVGVYTRWRKQWWWTFLMDDKMTWPPTWWHFLELGFSGLKRPEKPNSIEIFYCL